MTQAELDAYCERGDAADALLYEGRPDDAEKAYRAILSELTPRGFIVAKATLGLLQVHVDLDDHLGAHALWVARPPAPSAQWIVALEGEFVSLHDRACYALLEAHLFSLSTQRDDALAGMKQRVQRALDWATQQRDQDVLLAASTNWQLSLDEIYDGGEIPQAELAARRSSLVAAGVSDEPAPDGLVFPRMSGWKATAPAPKPQKAAPPASALKPLNRAPATPEPPAASGYGAQQYLGGVRRVLKQSAEAAQLISLIETQAVKLDVREAPTAWSVSGVITLDRRAPFIESAMWVAFFGAHVRAKAAGRSPVIRAMTRAEYVAAQCELVREGWWSQILVARELLASVAPPVRAAILKLRPIAHYYRLAVGTPSPSPDECVRELKRGADDLAALRMRYVETNRVSEERQRRYSADWERRQKI